MNEGKTIRLTVSLNTDEDGYTVVNYEELIKKEKLKLSNGEGTSVNAIEENEDQDKHSKSPEEKFGQTKRKLSSFTALGAGYDESDSFIDNSEANEEGLPEGVDTKYGGFYINCGKLEFKDLKPPDAIKKTKKLENRVTSRSTPAKKKKIQELTKESDIKEDIPAKRTTTDDGLLRNNNNNLIAPVTPGQSHDSNNQTSIKSKTSKEITSKSQAINKDDAIQVKKKKERSCYAYLKPNEIHYERAKAEPYQHTMVPPNSVDVKSKDKSTNYLKATERSIMKASSHNQKVANLIETAGNIKLDRGTGNKNPIHNQKAILPETAASYLKPKDNLLEKTNATASTSTNQFGQPNFPKKPRRKADGNQIKNQTEKDSATYVQPQPRSIEAKITLLTSAEEVCDLSTNNDSNPILHIGLDDATLRLIKELEKVVVENKIEKNKTFNQPVVNLLNKLEKICRTSMNGSHRQQIYDYLSRVMGIPKLTLLKSLEKIIAKYQPALKEEPRFNTLMPLDVIQIKEIKKGKLNDLNPQLKRQHPHPSKSDGKDSRPTIPATFLNKVNPIPPPERNDHVSDCVSTESLPKTIINQLIKRDISIFRVTDQTSSDKKPETYSNLNLKPSKDELDKRRREKEEEEETKAATSLLSQLVTNNDMDNFVEHKEDEIVCLSAEELQSLRTKQQYDEVIKDLVSLNKLKRETGDKNDIVF